MNAIHGTSSLPSSIPSTRHQSILSVTGTEAFTNVCITYAYGHGKQIFAQFSVEQEAQSDYATAWKIAKLS